MAKAGPERKWLIHKTGSRHPWTYLAKHHETIEVGPHGSRKVFGGQPPGGGKGKKPKSVTEKLKEKSTQSGDEAMNAAPGSHPAEPANAEAVYTTGPGEAVEYDYQRTGTYADEYAAQEQNQQMSAERNPLPSALGPGQVYTGAAANPT